MTSQPIRVMFFCLGNICRSPLAEALFRHHVALQGFDDRFEINSSGTSAYHIGEPPDPGSVQIARERLNLDISGQRAQQLSDTHIREYDYLVAMDRSNLANAESLQGAGEANLLLFRDFEPNDAHRGSDVPDPWGGGSSQFEKVYDIVHRCAESLLNRIIETENLS